MLEPIRDLPDGLCGLRASGRVASGDYDRVARPLLERARHRGERVRLLYELAPGFEGFAPAAAWHDLRLGTRHVRRLERCAVVTDQDWAHGALPAVAALLPCPVKVFGHDQRAQAIDWLRHAPVRTVEHHLLPRQNVLLALVRGAPDADDLDELEAAADAWFESEGALRGLVVQARDGAGTECVDALLRELCFARDQHRSVPRIAIAADADPTALPPDLAEQFVTTAIGWFAADELGRAVAWASGELTELGQVAGADPRVDARAPPAVKPADPQRQPRPRAAASAET
jgi:hypothetical protein